MSTSLALLALAKQKYAQFQTLETSGVATSDVETGDKNLNQELRFQCSFARVSNHFKFTILNYSDSYFKDSKLWRRLEGEDFDGKPIDVQNQEIAKNCVRLLQNLLMPQIARQGRNIFQILQASIVDDNDQSTSESCSKLVVEPSTLALVEYIWIGNKSHLVRAVENRHEYNAEKLGRFILQNEKSNTKFANQRTVNRIVFDDLTFS